MCKKYRGGGKTLVFPLFFTDSGQDSRCRKVKTLYRKEGGDREKDAYALARFFTERAAAEDCIHRQRLTKKLGEAHNVFVSDTGTIVERTNDVLLQESSEEGK